jgi:hypothetical protein
MSNNQLLSSKIAVIEVPPQNPAITGTSLSDCAMEAVCKRGPMPGSVGNFANKLTAPTLVTGFGQFAKIFGGFSSNSEGALAAQMFFDNGGINLWVSRAVHYTTPTNPNSQTATTGEVVLKTAVLTAQPAVMKSLIAGPYNLSPGQTLLISLDGGAPSTTTFSATAAVDTGSNTQPFALTNGDTFVLSIDGEPNVTVTFLTSEFVSIGAATAAEVIAVINAALAAAGSPAVATVSAGAVRITTTTEGTASSIQIFAGNNGSHANTILGFVVGTTSGTGNVANIATTTAAEVETAIVATIGGAVTGSVVGGAPEITTVATGPAVSLETTGGTAQATIGFALSVIYSGSAAGAIPTLVVQGKTPGSYANAVQPQITAATNAVTGDFNLIVLEQGAVVEVWPNLSMIPTAANYAPLVVNDVNQGSDYVFLTDEMAAVGFPSNVPANGTFTMTGGGDGLVGLTDADYTGNPDSGNGPTGLHTFDQTQVIRLLIVPGVATPAVHNGMLTYCEAFRFGSMFAILDPPAGFTAAEMVTYVVTTALLEQSSEFGAIYWPQIQIANPDTTVYGTAAAITVPPSGAIAGRYAANDASSPGGIYEAPAGMGQSPANAGWGQLLGALGLETNEVMDETKRDLIYPELINPIVGLTGLPIHMDGAKTLLSTGNFPTIGERRGIIYIEQSLEIGLVPFKHRKIKASTLAALGRAIKSFLTIQTRNDAFASDDPTQAFSVDTGADINTPADAQALEMNATIGVATAKPGEFIILRVGQDTSLLQTQLAQAA